MEPPTACWQNQLMFDDLLESNLRFQDGFSDPGLPGTAARGLAVLTCIDSRIDPLALLGLRPGDAKIIRNAGARVTADALRSLVLATNLLKVTRVCLIQHTECAVIGSTDSDLRGRVSEARGEDASSWDFHGSTDHLAAFQADLEAIRECTLLPPGLGVGCFIYDVHTGALEPVDPDETDKVRP